jgi:2-keto-4-pentenoate hydratase/2-oxohepta-3-ene-1,7-dioic acid hydratase in catechol pathway
MKYQLFNFSGHNGDSRLGMRVDDAHFDLGTGTIDALLEDWGKSREILERLAVAKAGTHSDLDPTTIDFLPPLSRPGVIYGAGANYRDHVIAMAKAFDMELAADPKREGIPPWHFIKAGRGTLAAHRQVVPYPAHTQCLDWEAELAVVIGTECRDVSEKDALSHIAGYTVANDLSARDNLRRDRVDVTSPFRFDWIGHKCFEGSCPMGPYFTPADFVPSPETLDIKLWVNDELKQDSNTSNHLYSVVEQIAYLSGRLALYPGDVILTGTPAGVGMESGTFLKRGDQVRVWIDGLGELDTTLR